VSGCDVMGGGEGPVVVHVLVGGGLVGGGGGGGGVSLVFSRLSFVTEHQ
jgi:hypothetical protein